MTDIDRMIAASMKKQAEYTALIWWAKNHPNVRYREYLKRKYAAIIAGAR
jgi:hypothetical protein